MAHVAKYKEVNLKALVDAIDTSNVVGLVSVEGIPASQLQKMRKVLGEGTGLVVTKNTLLDLAIKEAEAKKKGLGDMAESIDGQMALLTAQENPFKLYQKINKTKTRAPAKGGETAPEDVEVKQGETDFKPGPIVGEMQKAGIPAAIEEGKVVIKKDKVLVKAGDKISRDVAQMLTQLDIMPLTVGLDLRVAYEEGILYKKDVLDVDVDAYIGNLKSAAAGAFNLAVYTAYTTPVTITPLLTKAHSEAFNLAMFANILTKDTIKFHLAKARVQMLGLANTLGFELGETKKEAPKEEPKEEPKKEEPAAEEKPKEETKAAEAPKEEPKEEKKDEGKEDKPESG